MLTSRRKNEIRDKANNIIKSSDKYHFIHATYACQRMIKDMVSSFYKTECLKLSSKIREKTKNGGEIPDDLNEEYERLMILAKEGRAHIDVDSLILPLKMKPVRSRQPMHLSLICRSL